MDYHYIVYIRQLSIFTIIYSFEGKHYQATIQHLMKNKLKSFVLQFLTLTYGSALVFLRPKKARQLSEAGMTLVLSNSMSITDRLMRRAILQKLEKAQDYKTLSELHQNYWTNKGTDFCLSMEDRFKTEFLPNWAFIFDILKEELSNQSEEFNLLVEIGTGDGEVLNYLSSEFPKIDRFVGIDLSPNQVEINNKKFTDNKRLDFVASDGFDWVNQHGQSNTIFVTSGGVLEYFTELRLQEFLSKVNSLGKIIFIAIEPKGADHNFETNPKSELYGHERSFSHNYPNFFKNAGFSLWHLSYKPFDKSTIFSFIGAKN